MMAQQLWQQQQQPRVRQPVQLSGAVLARHWWQMQLMLRQMQQRCHKTGVRLLHATLLRPQQQRLRLLLRPPQCWWVMPALGRQQRSLVWQRQQLLKQGWQQHSMAAAALLTGLRRQGLQQPQLLQPQQ
jgi:hypothetical protein